MIDAIHEETYKGFKIQIVPDLDPMNPRTEFDNVGTMICFHRKYNLGDEHEYRHEDYSGWNELEAQIAKDFGKNLLILPLYLMDHSGLSISTSPFSCRWDSGQIGFIVCSLKKAKEEWGMKGQLTKGWDGLANFTLNDDGTYRTLREAAIQYLEGEVKEYDARNSIDHHIEREKKKKQERKKVEIRHRVPLAKRS